MYVADTGNHRIQKYAPGSTTGVTVAGDSAGNSGWTTSFLNSPTSVIVDNDGYIYVTDSTNKRVMKFPPNSTSGTSGTSIFGGSLGNTVYGIAFRDALQKDVFVTLDGARSLQWRTLGLSTINATVASGSSAFSSPQTLAVDGYGNVYVGDGSNSGKQVVMFCSGSWIRRVLILGASTTPKIKTPTGIALDSNMNLYVTSTTPDAVYKYVLY